MKYVPGYSAIRQGLNYILDFVSGYKLHTFIVILGKPAVLGVGLNSKYISLLNM